METHWLPSNNANQQGCRAFATFTQGQEMQKDFGNQVQAQFDSRLRHAAIGVAT